MKNEDYNLIFEKYQQVTEAGFSYAGNYSDSTEQPKRQLAKFRRAKNDLKNSTSYSTASLPTGPQAKINVANMGTGSGLAEQEETDFNGTARHVPLSEVHAMYQKMMKEVHRLYKEKKFKQLESKLEFMAMLTRNM